MDFPTLFLNKFIWSNVDPCFSIYCLQSTWPFVKMAVDLNCDCHITIDKLGNIYNMESCTIIMIYLFIYLGLYLLSVMYTFQCWCLFICVFLSFYIGEGNGTPLQYSCLENHMDGGAWWAAVHGVAKSQTRLSNFTFTFHFHALEKEMATHSSVLEWRIPGTGEPGGLLSMGSHRVRHDWSDLATAIASKAFTWFMFPATYYLTI